MSRKTKTSNSKHSSVSKNITNKDTSNSSSNVRQRNTNKNHVTENNHQKNTRFKTKKNDDDDRNHTKNEKPESNPSYKENTSPLLGEVTLTTSHGVSFLKYMASILISGSIMNITRYILHLLVLMIVPSLFDEIALSPTFVPLDSTFQRAYMFILDCYILSSIYISLYWIFYISLIDFAPNIFIRGFTFGWLIWSVSVLPGWIDGLMKYQVSLPLQLYFFLSKYIESFVVAFSIVVITFFVQSEWESKYRKNVSMIRKIKTD
eukprot:gb/GECH01005035.1/.p1 GENE.gb/GECH01005035.1/~~gb/GECH01005035.1/.p1  ORF type:complete len:262 (+),score=31.90 gb/GECH01005035.1/:1-786(+)